MGRVKERRERKRRGQNEERQERELGGGEESRHSDTENIRTHFRDMALSFK